MPAVWQIKNLRPIQHRIIWWFVDAGLVGSVAARGWQQECAASLGIHRLTLRANVIRMVSMGVMKDGEKRGEVILIASLFDRKVDRGRLKKTIVDAGID